MAYREKNKRKNISFFFFSKYLDYDDSDNNNDNNENNHYVCIDDDDATMVMIMMTFSICFKLSFINMSCEFEVCWRLFAIA